MSKFLVFSLKLAFYISLIFGIIPIVFNYKENKFEFSSLLKLYNIIMSNIVLFTFGYLYYFVQKSMTPEETYFSRGITVLVLFVKYVIVMMLFSKSWLSKKQLLNIYNYAFKISLKFDRFEFMNRKMKISEILFLAESLSFMCLLMFAVRNCFTSGCKLHLLISVFDSLSRYPLNSYFIIIIYHKKLLFMLKNNIKVSVRKFEQFLKLQNDNFKSCAIMMESTKFCDELDDYFATFDDIINSMKKIHKLMESILLLVTGLLMIDCLIAVRINNFFYFFRN